MLGEAAVTYEDSDRYYKQYEQAIIQTGKGKNPHKKSISIKLSSLHPRYERNKLDLLKKELFPKAYNLLNFEEKIMLIFVLMQKKLID